MKVIIDLCVIPMGTTASVSSYIAECQRVLAGTGLSYAMHPYGTNIEGEWDEVMAAVKACHEAVHKMGAPRISSTVKIGTRIDKQQTMQDKVDIVNDLLSS